MAQLSSFLQGVDFVFHLAGINRPQDPQEFVAGNVGLTRALCQAVGAIAVASGKKVPVVYTSSTQAARDNPYGLSKRGAESALFELQSEHCVPVHIFRLPNVFGKWCKPNYNSAVATFCHNITRGLPIQVNDPVACLTPVHVFAPEEIKAIRAREHISQPVFARYLNVSKNLVSDWERGVKKPGGPALRLLTVIQKKGLRAVA